MSLMLRVVLIALSLLFIVFVFCTVNRRKLQMRYSLIWLILSFCLLVVALFPQLVVWASRLAGVETPSNFIYLLGIFFLLVVAFSQTVNLSKQADRTKKLIQMISIEKYLRERENEGRERHETEN